MTEQWSCPLVVTGQCPLIVGMQTVATQLETLLKQLDRVQNNLHLAD